MSNSTIRHVNSLGMKYEVLKEVKHWKQACTDCTTEVRGNINSLKESRGVIKREINSARALLETTLRELEQDCERELIDMVSFEVRKMTEFVEKLEQSRKRLNSIDLSLKNNLVGYKLNKTIDEGKRHATASRETLMEIRKYEMPSRVEFNLTDHLLALLEKYQALGTLSLVTHTGSKRGEGRNEGKIEETNKFSNGFVETEEIVQLNGDKLEGQHTKSDLPLSQSTLTPRPTSIENTMINDLDFIIKMDSKFKHSLKPFLDEVRNRSSVNNKVVNDKKRNVNTQIQKPIKTQQSQKPLVGILRPNSDRINRPNGVSLDTRPSKSAREGDRKIPTNTKGNACLNDLKYEHFEEQGPIADKLERKTSGLNVRYNDRDLVKELTTVEDEETVISDNRHVTQRANYQLVNDQVYDLGFRIASSVSSVSYKPSKSLSSSPLYLKRSREATPRDGFQYIARFYTKKHTQETDLCRLTSLVALDSGHIVVADINHQQIMLLAPDFTYLDSLECPSPCGLGLVSENIIAATLFHNRKIMLIKVHMFHLERQRDIHVPCQEPLYAVTYRNGRYYVLCSSGEIHILDENGKQAGLVQTGVCNGEARFMDISLDAKLFFVSGKDKVICFGDTGERLWQYKSRDKHRRFTPGGVVLYHDRLFVADWSGNKITELSVEGSFVRDVVTDNVEFPHAIAVQQKQGRMLVSQSNHFKQEAKSRSIKVFKMQ